MQQQINKDTKVTDCQRKSCAMNHDANTVIEYFLNKIAASNYYTVIHDRKSQVLDVSVSESIYILRCLGDNESWAKEISEHCVKVIKRVNENLSNGFVYIDGFEVDIRKALSVILVLGGYVESTRVGGHVVLIDSMQNRRSAPAIDVNLSLRKKSSKRSQYLVVEVDDIVQSMNDDPETKTYISNSHKKQVVRLTGIKKKTSKFMEKAFKMPTIFSASMDNLKPIAKKESSKFLLTFWKDTEIGCFVEKIIGSTQPGQFDFNSTYLWQNLRSATLRALTFFVDLSNDSLLLSSGGRILNNLQLLLSHPRIELAKVAEQTESLVVMEQQAKLLNAVPHAAMLESTRDDTIVIEVSRRTKFPAVHTKANSIDRNTKTAFSNESKSEVSTLKPLLSRNSTTLEELPIDEAHSKGESTWKITVKCNDGEYFIGGTVFYCNQKNTCANRKGNHRSNVFGYW